MIDNVSPSRPIFAVSSGDPAGIGPEILIKSWQARRENGLPDFFVVGDIQSFDAIANGVAKTISGPEETAEVFANHLPVLQVHNCLDYRPGAPNDSSAQCALQALEMAVGLARSGRVDGMVTGPVSKNGLHNVGFTHPGQTEFIAERCGVARENANMMLAGPSLKVVPLTVHIPVRQITEYLSADLIIARTKAVAKAMHRNFGLARPRIAVAGLNPHAGEDGRMGQEEQLIISPALHILRDEGYDIIGPLAADSMFHTAARAQYDVALCQYHDQALIPLKTLDFDDGVNMTLGLPVIRTSPDHGTAFDIAGQNKASPQSMISALQMAQYVMKYRLEYDAQTSAFD